MSSVDNLLLFLEELYNNGKNALTICHCRYNQRYNYFVSGIIPLHTRHCHEQLFALIYGDEESVKQPFTVERKCNKNVYTIEASLLDSYYDYKDIFTYNGITLLEFINKIKQYIQYIQNQDRLHTILQIVCIDNVNLIEVCLKELCMNNYVKDSYISAKIDEYIRIVNQL